MSVQIPRGTSDQIVDKIIAVLEKYERDHPRARIAVYRHSPVSVRVRIVDPEFSELDTPQRHQVAWKYLDELDDDSQGDISTLLLLTPNETKKSFANLEFDDPVPSEL